MNTRIEYMYRDAANYKQNGHWIITGPATEEQVERLRTGCLNDGDGAFFIPDLVGIPPLQGDWDDEIDHNYHTLDDILPTDENADDTRTIEELINDFEERNWEEEADDIAVQKAA